MIGEKGKGLVFIISQPRSGSTMLQRILGSHSKVHTEAETWLLLPFLRVLNKTCHQDGSETCYARQNIRHFLNTIPDGLEKYYGQIRHFCAALYNSSLERHGKEIFLDKAPRYAYVLPELSMTFPEAKYIFLYRNPVAILCSVMMNWADNDPELLKTYRDRDDLLTIPFLMRDHAALFWESRINIRYEDLIREPEKIMERICSHLDIEYNPEIIRYNEHGLPKWNFADHKVYNWSRPDADNANAWIDHVKDPVRKKLALEYIGHLGKGLIDSMGYSYDHMAELLLR